MQTEKIRNVAIIAHVDHGKTTLVDAFLKQSKLFRDNQNEMVQEQILDSGDLEREKGITIKSKNASIRYKDYKINIIDTPGHADFGGEVERILTMAEGCILLVDAQEGPMPQTKFVLHKALKLGLKPILVINKIDKPAAAVERVLDQVHDLFLQLATSDDQLDFAVYYAIGREGKAFAQMPSDPTIAADISPILDGIIEHIPPCKGKIDDPVQLQITSIDYDSHLGRKVIGKIARGRIAKNTRLALVHARDPQAVQYCTIKSVMVREGLTSEEVLKAGAGEIVILSGIETTDIGATLCDPDNIEPLPAIDISPPALKMKFEANTSPFLGREGEFITLKQIQQRLDREAENNIGLKIEKTDGGGYYVAGRGELQLAILIETMRREGYEFQVRKPEVVLKEIDGKTMQPLEELTVDIPEEYQSTVISALTERKAEIVHMDQSQGYSRIVAKILTSKLLGLRNQLVAATKNQAVLNNQLIDYVPYTQEPEMYRNGVLISSATGKAMGYSLNTIQERGELFIDAATEVYEGMIIGLNKFEQDMEVNPTKERQKSGVRMKHDEITQTSLKSIRFVTLEFALVFLGKDEILEVTPKSLRLRKTHLKEVDRTRIKRQEKNLK